MTEEAGSPLTHTPPHSPISAGSLSCTHTLSLALYAVTPAPTPTLKGPVSQMAKCST